MRDRRRPALAALRRRRHGHTQARVIAEIARAIRGHVADGRDLLELDAGSGRQTVVFRDQLLHPSPPWIYEREDLRAPNVASQTRFAPVDFERDRFPVADDSFDVVVWRQELVTVKDILLPLGEIDRVLRRDGLFLLSVPNLAALHNRLLLLAGRQPTTLHIQRGNHIRGFALRPMTGFLRTRGWHVVDVKGVGLHPFASGAMPRPVRDLSHTALWLLTHDRIRTTAVRTRSAATARSHTGAAPWRCTHGSGP